MRQYKIHLVGSIPLRDAAEVYETVSSALGPRLLRIPDGETGERTGWMGWLNPDFQLHPDLEPTDETFRPHAAGTATVRYRLKPSANADRFEFTNLRHAGVAIEAYKTFARLKDEKKIPQHCRYQFALAHPVSIASHYGVAEAQPVIEREYERALVREIEKMAAAIPHDQLAIQWDVASADICEPAAVRADATWLNQGGNARGVLRVLRSPRRGGPQRSSISFITSAMAIPVIAMRSSRWIWPTWSNSHPGFRQRVSRPSSSSICRCPVIVMTFLLRTAGVTGDFAEIAHQPRSHPSNRRRRGYAAKARQAEKTA